MSKSERPRLLMLTSSFPRGPRDETCGYVRDLARCLAADFDVRVLAPPDREAEAWPPDEFTLARSTSLLPGRLDPFQASADLQGIIGGNPLKLLAAGLSLLSYASAAFKLARRNEVICSHWLVPCGLVGALLARLLGKPHVVVEHSGALHLLTGRFGKLPCRGGTPCPPLRAGWRFLKKIARLAHRGDHRGSPLHGYNLRFGGFLTKFIVRNSRQVITVSRDLKGKFIALCPEAADKTVVMPMGTTCKDKPSCPSGARQILFVGRLTRIKGVAVLLRAARLVENVHVSIAGDGECRADLEALARALSVNATFLGRIDAAQRERLFSECDIVVIPSVVLPGGRTEGLPVVCLEAMAAGRVVIAADTGGLAEVIIDGHNGLLFAPGDHRRLAELLGRVLADADLRTRLSAEAQRTAAAYDWRRVGAHFAAIIHDALKGDGDIHGQRINVHPANR